MSMRWTIEDGDTESGNFDDQNVQLGVNNIPIDSASDLTAYSHDENGGSTSSAVVSLMGPPQLVGSRQLIP